MSENINVELDASLDDVERTRRDVEDTHTGIDLAQDVLATLESIVSRIEATLEGHGLTPQEAVFVNLTLESQYQRIGIERTSFTMESFGGTRSRLQASQEAHLDIKTKIQEIWKALIAMVRRAWLAVLNFFDVVIGTATLLEKAANETAEQARTISSPREPRSKTIQLSEVLARRLAVGPHISWDIARNLEKTSKRLQADGNRLTEMLRASFHGMRDAILHKDPSKLAFIPNVIEQTLTSGFDKEYEKDGRAYVETTTLPGNVKFQLSYRILDDSQTGNEQTQEGLEEITQLMSSMRCEMVPVDSPHISTTLNTLNLHDINLICVQVANIAKWSLEFKKNLSTLSKEAEEAMRATGAFVLSVGGAPFAGQDKHSLTVRISDSEHELVYRAYAHTAAFMVKPAVILQQYIIRIARTSLYVAQKSLAEYMAGQSTQQEPEEPGTAMVLR